MFGFCLVDVSHSSRVKPQKPKAKPPKASSKGTRIPKYTANPLKTKRKKKGSGISDVESVRTEDFENSFHKIMVKQVLCLYARSSNVKP
jgi:hypothetical protein